eukprot:3382623-Amphidinium_carterae.1
MASRSDLADGLGQRVLSGLESRWPTTGLGWGERCFWRNSFCVAVLRFRIFYTVVVAHRILHGRARAQCCMVTFS